MCSHVSNACVDPLQIIYQNTQSLRVWHTCMRSQFSNAYVDSIQMIYRNTYCGTCRRRYLCCCYNVEVKMMRTWSKFCWPNLIQAPDSHETWIHRRGTMAGAHRFSNHDIVWIVSPGTESYDLTKNALSWCYKHNISLLSIQHTVFEMSLKQQQQISWRFSTVDWLLEYGTYMWVYHCRRRHII